LPGSACLGIGRRRVRNFSGIVLAGGGSRRLGQNKALVTVGERTLVEIVLERLGRVCKDLILSTNDPDKFAFLGVRVVPDVYAGRGVLGGLYSGLKSAKYPHAVAVACDMPFLSPSLLRFMILHIAGHDVVVPRLSAGLEPLHAIYARTCLEPMREALEGGQLRVVDFWDRVKVRYIEEREIEILDPDKLSFFNINTPEDLATARQLAGST
jgi:molybdopterin-guanine dinucleotide biosynthesis protein A